MPREPIQKVKRGRLITFEGIEGSGKSTHAKRLADSLGFTTVLSREPGGTPLGARVRSILLDARDLHIAPFAESLLFLADRKQHLDEVILPSLASGRTVVVDRFIDSSLAYQGAGRAVPRDFIRKTFEAMGGVWPDLTILLDLPVEESLTRLEARGGANRIDGEAKEFHERVRQAFLDLAKKDEKRYAVLDATLPMDALARAVTSAVSERLGLATRKP